MLPLPARTLVLLTLVQGARVCPLGSSGASPVSEDQWKQRRQRQLPAIASKDFTWDSE